MRRIFLLLTILLLVCTAIYWPVHRFGFIQLDDGSYVWANTYVQAGFTSAGVREAFSTFKMGNWNPLLWFSFYADHALFGLQPGPMHCENVLLHLLSGLLLWRLLYNCTGKMFRGFAVAVLFVVHPMHVESVAWISERKDVLSTPLLLGAMLAYVRYCKREPGIKRQIDYAVMLLLFILSLMAKSMGVTLPAVLLLMDFWPLRRWPVCRVKTLSHRQQIISLWVEKIPLMVISVAFAIVSAFAQQSIGAVTPYSQIGVAVRIANIVVCYAIYILKLIIPTNLAVIYPYPDSRSAEAFVGSLIVLLLISAACYRYRHRWPYLLTGWLWFLGTLVPVIGLVQIGAQSMADRYSYFPSIGLLIIAVWGLGDLADILLPRDVSKIAIGLCMFFAVLAYSVFARKQVDYWQNSRLLFNHANQVTQDNYVVHRVLGELDYKNKDLNAAAAEFELAIAQAPDAAAFDGLGNCLLGVDLKQAIDFYKRAIDANPLDADYHLDLAVALRLNRDFVHARAQAEAALALDPSLTYARQELEKISAASGSSR